MRFLINSKDNYTCHKCIKNNHCIEIYGEVSNTLTNKKQMMDNKWLKILFLKDRWTSANEINKQFAIVKVNDLYEPRVLEFNCKCVNRDFNLSHTMNLNILCTTSMSRGTNTINFIFLHSSLWETSLKNKGAILWNNIPRNIRLKQSHFNNLKDVINFLFARNYLTIEWDGDSRWKDDTIRNPRDYPFYFL